MCTRPKPYGMPFVCLRGPCNMKLGWPYKPLTKISIHVGRFGWCCCVPAHQLIVTFVGHKLVHICQLSMFYLHACAFFFTFRSMRSASCQKTCFNICFVFFQIQDIGSDAHASDPTSWIWQNAKKMLTHVFWYLAESIHWNANATWNNTHSFNKCIRCYLRASCAAEVVFRSSLLVWVPWTIALGRTPPTHTTGSTWLSTWPLTWWMHEGLLTLRNSHFGVVGRPPLSVIYLYFWLYLCVHWWFDGNMWAP